MPTIAQQRVAALSGWFSRNSRWGKTPNGDNLIVGQYAAIVPCRFDEPPPIIDHHPDALPFYVSHKQCVGMSFPDFEGVQPDTQTQSDERLAHVLFLIEDQRLPPVALVALASADEPIGAAIDRAGLSGADMASLAVLAVPTFLLLPGAQYRLRHRLPFIPRADAPDPDMPSDFVSRTIVGVSDRWN